jgi:amino acid permease
MYTESEQCWPKYMVYLVATTVIVMFMTASNIEKNLKFQLTATIARYIVIFAIMAIAIYSLANSDNLVEASTKPPSSKPFLHSLFYSLPMIIDILTYHTVLPGIVIDIEDKNSNNLKFMNMMTVLSIGSVLLVFGLLISVAINNPDTPELCLLSIISYDYGLEQLPQWIPYLNQLLLNVPIIALLPTAPSTANALVEDILSVYPNIRK